MITRSKLLHIVQETIIEFRNDDGRLLGAAMVYYVLLSLVPILLLLIAISGLFLRSYGACCSRLWMICSRTR